MRALVTGAAGSIGSTLTERLVRDRTDLVELDCFTDHDPRPFKVHNLAGFRDQQRVRLIESRIQGRGPREPHRQPCTVTASRHAISRLCTTRSRPRRPPPRRASLGACTIIGGGSRVSVHRVLEMVGRMSGRRPVVSVDPAQKGDMQHTCADTRRARTDLGFVPAVSLEEWLTAEHVWLTGILK